VALSACVEAHAEPHRTHAQGCAGRRRKGMCKCRGRQEAESDRHPPGMVGARVGKRLSTTVSRTNPDARRLSAVLALLRMAGIAITGVRHVPPCLDSSVRRVVRPLRCTCLHPQLALGHRALQHHVAGLRRWQRRSRHHPGGIDGRDRRVGHRQQALRAACRHRLSPHHRRRLRHLGLGQRRGHLDLAGRGLRTAAGLHLAQHPGRHYGQCGDPRATTSTTTGTPSTARYARHCRYSTAAAAAVPAASAKT
jgi:hypothetical protein